MVGFESLFGRISDSFFAALLDDLPITFCQDAFEAASTGSDDRPLDSNKGFGRERGRGGLLVLDVVVEV